MMISDFVKRFDKFLRNKRNQRKSNEEIKGNSIVMFFPQATRTISFHIIYLQK